MFFYCGIFFSKVKKKKKSAINDHGEAGAVKESAVRLPPGQTPVRVEVTGWGGPQNLAKLVLALPGERLVLSQDP